MGYIETILEPGERVRLWGDLHWSLHILTGLFLGLSILSAALAIWSENGQGYYILAALGLFFGLMGLITVLTTEIAVTNRRVLFKKGLIARRTTEMNLSKIESVDVYQSVLGRLFGFGTVTVRGTGSGLTPFRFIDKPLNFRRAILSP